MMAVVTFLSINGFAARSADAQLVQNSTWHREPANQGEYLPYPVTDRGKPMGSGMFGNRTRSDHRANTYSQSTYSQSTYSQTNYSPGNYGNNSYAYDTYSAPGYATPGYGSRASNRWQTNLDYDRPYGHREDLLNTSQHSLLDYRRLFINGTTPAPHELVGRWRGVNKGIVEIAGYKQFIKEITPTACDLRGDNIVVHQVSNDILRCCGWEPKTDPGSFDGLKRQGQFAVEAPRGNGPFRHGAIFNYRNGGNAPSDPARLLVDKVVKVDANHMVGRVTANFGPVAIPIAYFVLERIGY